MAVRNTGLEDRRGSRQQINPLTGEPMPFNVRGRVNPTTGVEVYGGLAGGQGGKSPYGGRETTGPAISQEQTLQNAVQSQYAQYLYDKYERGPQGFSTNVEGPDYEKNIVNFFQSIPDNRADFISKYPKAAPYESFLSQGEQQAFSSLNNLSYVKGGALDDFIKGLQFSAQVASWVAPFVVPLPPGVGEVGNLGAQTIGGPLSAVGGTIGAIGPASASIASSAIPAGMSLTEFSPGWAAGTLAQNTPSLLTRGLSAITPDFLKQIPSTVQMMAGAAIKNTIQDVTTPKIQDPYGQMYQDVVNDPMFASILNRQGAGNWFAMDSLDKDGLLPEGMENPMMRRNQDRMDVSLRPSEEHPKSRASSAPSTGVPTQALFGQKPDPIVNPLNIRSIPSNVRPDLNVSPNPLNARTPLFNSRVSPFNARTTAWGSRTRPFNAGIRLFNQGG